MPAKTTAPTRHDEVRLAAAQTAKSDATQELTDARAAAEATAAAKTEAQQRLGALEDRIRAGDAAVTPDTLAEATAAQRFAELRHEAATQRAAQAELSELRADASLAVAEAWHLLASDIELVDMYAAAVGALRTLTDADRKRGHAVNDMGRRLLSVDAALRRIGDDDGLQPYGAECDQRRAHMYPDDPQVRVDGVMLEQPISHYLTAAAVHEAVPNPADRQRFGSDGGVVDISEFLRVRTSLQNRQQPTPSAAVPVAVEQRVSAAPTFVLGDHGGMPRARRDS
jgi:hypothetical protein